jgi:hypothetical protein
MLIASPRMASDSLKPLPLLDPDGRIDHAGQPQPVDELVDQETAAVTDQRVVALFKDEPDSADGIDSLDLLHLHLLGDRDADSLYHAQSLVYG